MSRVAKLGAVTALVAVGAVCFAALNSGSGLFKGRLATAGEAVTASGSASSTVSSRAGSGRLADGRTPSGSDVAETQDTYIVVYREPAVAAYQGGIGRMAAPGRTAEKNGRNRLDVNSTAAVQYASYLEKQQVTHEASIAGAIGRAPVVQMRMRYAINATITRLTPSEAARVAKLPNVQLVEENRDIIAHTDVGPTLIGAPAIWNGSTPGATGAYKGEGVVVGVIDSGINFESPSFAAVDPIDSYTHVNPIAGGGFLGTCAPGGVDAGRCNTKLIGGYDFVCNAPGNACSNTAFREEPGFGDTNGHGSHTASTAAGNFRDAQYLGNTVRISGVAPRANIIAYDACYTNIATGQGLCPNVSTLASVEKAIEDGLVDVINYSIGGGTSPWTDAVSLAFLNAVEAGIYVATSAGNDGPAANTLGHLEPWVAATAASQHGRGAFQFLLRVSGPGTVPPAVSSIAVNIGTGGSAVFSASIPSTTPIKASPNFLSANDGCNVGTAYPAGLFQGSIAVVRRGTCAFSEKANNAAAAGAIAVVVANNDTPGLIPSVPGTTVQVFGISGPDGVALNSFLTANANATAGIAYPATRGTNVPDALASFSSRGPAASFNLVKPDITAPGSLILAAVSGDTITGFANAVDLISGTSMASPHNAGAAALLRQARPTWTPSEIKSALMLTAKTAVLLEDQVTPANAFARGAGRIRLERAINAGLVMDETRARYLAANPATGGDPRTLNTPSYGNRNCDNSCTFTRSFRNPTSATKTWYVRINGFRGSVSRPMLTVAPGATESVTVTIDSRSLPANGTWAMGNLRLSDLANNTDVLELPLAIAVQAPAIAVPTLIEAQHNAGANGSFTTTIDNTGGSRINYSVDNAATATVRLVTTNTGSVGSGFRGTRYTDPATAGSAAQFSADDFTLESATTIASLATDAFVVSNVALTTAALDINWSIFPDDNGLPAGNPQSAAGAAVWSYTASPTSAGVTISGGNVALNLVAAGQTVQLPPGKYWLVVSTRGTYANRWAWFGSNDGSGGFASITVTTTGTGAWAANNAFPSLNMRVQGIVQCGATWLGAATPASGTVLSGASQSVNVGILGSGLTAGTRTAFFCVSSNDPLAPRVATRVRLTTNAAP